MTKERAKEIVRFWAPKFCCEAELQAATKAEYEKLTEKEFEIHIIRTFITHVLKQKNGDFYIVAALYQLAHKTI